jgi:hypothetical protein
LNHFIIEIDKKFGKNEKGDDKVIFNLNLLSELLRANGVILIEENTLKRILDIFKWYRSTINKECIEGLTDSYIHMLHSTTNYYPIEACSVEYSLSYDDQNEFLRQHLPIRVNRSIIILLNCNFYFDILL